MNGNGQHPTDKQSILERERLYNRLLSAQALEGVERDMDGVDDMPLEEMEAIWTARAVQLARPPVEEQQGDQMELLLIRLGREVLGIEVRYVVEIRQNEPISPVPRVPSWVVGVTNLRGRILSVVDLRAFLGLPADPARAETGENGAPSDFLVEVESSDMELVLQVNEVLGVEALPASNIHPENGLIHALPPEYLRGVVKQENGRWITTDAMNGSKASEKADEQQGVERRADSVIVSVLNLNALLSDPRLIINDYAGDEDRN